MLCLNFRQLASHETRLIKSRNLDHMEKLSFHHRLDHNVDEPSKMLTMGKMASLKWTDRSLAKYNYLSVL